MILKHLLPNSTPLISRSRAVEESFPTGESRLQKIDELTGQRQDGAGKRETQGAGNGPGGLGATDGGLALGHIRQPVDEVVGLEEEEGRHEQDGLGLVADDPAEEHCELVPIAFLACRRRRRQHVRFGRLRPLRRCRFRQSPCVVVVLGTISEITGVGAWKQRG